MKLIDIGICIDNLDPKHMGRIRCVRYSSYTGEQEKAVDYNAWDDKDLFTANPFLPSNINFIPEIGQTVKILEYNTDKEFENVEYISGPFTTMHDYNSQTHSAQVENTTYGIAAKHSPDIAKSDKDELKENDGAFAKHTDYGIYGKYGSDVIFTENGLIMRGGKLISKKGASQKDKLKLTTQPILADKSATIHLKKFDKKLTPVTEEVDVNKVDSKPLTSFIEYSIQNFNTGDTTTIDFYVYVIKNLDGESKKRYGDNLYKTDNTNLENVDILGGKTKLINNYNDSSPTFSVSNISFNKISGTIREFIQKAHKELSLKSLNSDYNNQLYSLTNLDSDLHPFYFRPTKECVSRTLSDEETTLRQRVFDGVTPFTGIKQNGLIFSAQAVENKPKTSKKIQKYLKNEGGVEQSFGAIKSDKLYLLSTEEPAPKYKEKKPIKFDKFKSYDITHENYMEDIDPNTYALVRGEILLEVLYTMANLFASHVHLLESPLIQADPNYIDLMTKISNLENDMLNKSIRTN